MGYRAGTYANDGAGFSAANSGDTVQVTMGGAVSAGDTLHLHIVCFTNVGGGAAATFSISDSVNGAWSATADVSVTNVVIGNNGRQSIFSFPNSGAGTPVISVTLTNGGANNMAGGLQCLASSGLATSSVLDVAAGASGSGSSPSSGSTSATGAANEFVLAFYGDYGEGQTITTGSGFTQAGKHDADGGHWQGLAEYKDSGASGSTPAGTVTLPGSNSGWIMLVAVYKPPPSGFTGTIAANLPALTIAGSGAERFSGTIAANLTALTISATGTIPGGTTGSIAVVLGNIQGAGTGGETFIGAIAAILPALQVAARGGLPQNYYTTTFPLTENPISESGVWENLGSNPTMLTTTHKAYSDGPNDTDAIATLLGTWGADQHAQATVFNTITADTGSDNTSFAEVELHLRVTPGATQSLLYECLFSANPSHGYVEIVKWLPATGDFISLTGGAVGGAIVSTGDVVSATIIGNTITSYINGVQVAQATDTGTGTSNQGHANVAPYSSGNPGMGHWIHNNNGIQLTRRSYGFTAYTADTLYRATVAANLPALQVTATGIVGNGIAGSITANLPKLQVAASGTQTDNGTIAANLPALQIAATGLGQTGNIGAIAATLGALSISASGSETFIGSAAARLPGPVVVAAGSIVLLAPPSGAAVLNTTPTIGVAVAS